MPSKRKTEDVEFRFELPGPKGPGKLLANAELVFNTGLLAGLRLTGFALWKAQGEKGGFISVTFPSRPTGPRRYFEYLRTLSGDAKDLDVLKGALVNAYKAHLAAAHGHGDPSEPNGDAADPA